MNVSSVGGAASLPVPLSPPAAAPAAGTPAGTHPGTTATPPPRTASGSPGGSSGGTSGAGAGGAGAGGSGAGGVGTGGTVAGASVGELRLPGQPPAQGTSTSVAEHKKQAPKPAPLPPLKGLTVAEIRAMLGVAAPPVGADGVPGTTTGVTATSLQAAASRYA